MTINQETIRQKLRAAAEFFLNPRLLLCAGIGWFITNGWSYVMLGLGTLFKIQWMIAVSSAYLAFLWFPFTPEKLVTLVIAIALLRLFFPHDQKTLRRLHELYDSVKQKHGKNKK